VDHASADGAIAPRFCRLINTIWHSNDIDTFFERTAAPRGRRAIPDAVLACVRREICTDIPERLVAVKVIDHSTSPSSVAAVRREIDYLRGLSGHPFLVRYYAAFLPDATGAGKRRSYLVFQEARGVPLRDWQEATSAAGAARLVLGVLSALAWTQGRVDPDGILVDDLGLPKLCCRAAGNCDVRRLIGVLDRICERADSGAGRRGVLENLWLRYGERGAFRVLFNEAHAMFGGRVGEAELDVFAAALPPLPHCGEEQRHLGRLEELREQCNEQKEGLEVEFAKVVYERPDLSRAQDELREIRAGMQSLSSVEPVEDPRTKQVVRFEAPLCIDSGAPEPAMGFGNGVLATLRATDTSVSNRHFYVRLSSNDIYDVLRKDSSRGFRIPPSGWLELEFDRPIASGAADKLVVSGDNLVGLPVRFVRVADDGAEYTVVRDRELARELPLLGEWTSSVFRLYWESDKEDMLIRQIDMRNGNISRIAPLERNAPALKAADVRLTAAAYDQEHFFLRPIGGTKISTFQQIGVGQPSMEIELTRHTLLVHGFAAAPGSDAFVLSVHCEGKWTPLEIVRRRKITEGSGNLVYYRVEAISRFPASSSRSLGRPASTSCGRAPCI
jgi:hypothetical protein